MKKSIVALGIVLALSGCAAAADETLAAEPAALVEISPATEETARRWKLLQLPNLRRQQPLRRHPNRHRPPRPRRQQSLRKSPPQNPRKPRWRKP